MRRGFRSVFTVALLIFLLGQGAAGALEAGAAKVEIVAPPGTPLDGYVRRMGRGAVAALDSLWVRALYLETDDTALFLVSADLYSITPELRERVLDLVPEGVPGEHVILTATHTHSGPGGMSASWVDRRRSGRFMPEFLEQTAGAFGEAMRGAYAARKRAVAGYAVTRLDSLTENAFSEDGPTDPQLGVIRVEDSDGAPIAVLANFAALAATVSDDHAYVLSADFPGRFCEALETAMDGGGVAFFLNGASGDQDCRNPDEQGDWDWAASIGASLAARVQAVAESIQCREPKVHVGYSEPTLPRAIGARGRPGTALLQTLEIDGLLVSFIPGLAYAEVGLELRERAKARGYAEHMVVGPANGFEGSFVSYGSYGAGSGERGRVRFGPAAADWLYENLSELMTRGEHERSTSVSMADVETTDFAGRKRITLRTSPYARGFQRGQALYEEIREAYEGLVLESVRDGKIGVEDALWRVVRRPIDTAPLVLPELANRMRPLLAGLLKGDLEEMHGLADATDLPFWGIWLLQTRVYFAEDDAARTRPVEAMFSVTAGRTGGEGTLAGHALDEGRYAAHHVVEVRPEAGQGYVAVGPAWDLGVRSGMNEAGLVVCVQRAPDLGRPGFDAPPIGFVARSVLASQVAFAEAVEAFRTVEGLRGFRVLVASRAETEAAVIEFGDEVVVERSVNGVLVREGAYGRSPGHFPSVTGAGLARLLAGEGTVDISRAQMALRYYEETGGTPRVGQTWVVFEPEAYRIHIAFQDADGVGRPYETLSIGGDRR